MTARQLRRACDTAAPGFSGNSHPCGRAALYQARNSFKQMRRKHHVAIFVALDLHQHSLGGGSARGSRLKRWSLKVTDPDPLPNEPICQKCNERMRFSCTEPDKPGFVHHVYECRKCRSTQSFVTAV
jgi:hypothetical protein